MDRSYRDSRKGAARHALTRVQGRLHPRQAAESGFLLFFAIEGILRKPLGERQRQIAQQIGLVLLVSIMVFALWNDIERFITR